MITGLNVQTDTRLTKNVNRRLELKIVLSALTVRSEILRLKRKELKGRREELANMNEELRNTQNRYCDEIWGFSSRHNFNKVFNRYPDGTQIIESHKCKYNSAIDEAAGKTDTQLKLKQEIHIINNELKLVRNNNNVVDDLKRCRVTLDNLISFSEEVLKLIRSISAISAADSSLSISDTNENQKACNYTNNEFTSARTLLLNESGFRNSVLTERNHVSNSTNITGEIKRHLNVKNTTVKHRTFVLKKPSSVALRYLKETVGNRQ